MNRIYSQDSILYSLIRFLDQNSQFLLDLNVLLNCFVTKFIHSDCHKENKYKLKSFRALFGAQKYLQ